ncbi:protein phosphatase 2C domain-containing protein [Streptomyces sp. ICC1]|uniref:protein phosphatase 2C domain-containing protein n=1 Tax=Streptomyces sp. ICC1 TaxID=2099583 RepID=UPI000DC7C600|nr:protein phosphatase 2C domain-containing protein [Streptomyces sp. ICC1]AWZ12858.1 cell division protein [Streptomyces sp. ICC1]
MSQPGAGADDWWQKLYYEDPDAGPDPDPRDTLDHRFRSAAVLVAPPAVPGPRRDPERSAEPVPEPGAEPEPVPGVEPEPEDAYTDSVLPPPRDPREGGQTWYALGDVAVPPALPDEEPDGPAARGWGVRGEEPAAAETPERGPAGAEQDPDTGPGPAAAPGFALGFHPGSASGWGPGPDSAPGSGSGHTDGPGSGAGSGHGSDPGSTPSSGHGSAPGSAPGFGHGSDPGSTPSSGLGSAPGSAPGLGHGSIPGSGHGSAPGSAPGSGHGSAPGSAPGFGHGSAPGSGHGSALGSGHGSAPGSGHGSVPGAGPGHTLGSGLGASPGPGPGSGAGFGGGADPEPEPDPGQGSGAGGPRDGSGPLSGAEAGRGDEPRTGSGSATGGTVPTASPVPPRPVVTHLGDRPPTYAAEPVALPAADPAGLDALTPDTVLEGAQYGAYTLRAASVRGDSARFRGEARRDFLLTARFGGGPDALVLVVLAGGDRSAPGAADASAELCRSVARAVGRSQERLADDIRTGRREALRSGLQRLTDRGYGRLRARAAELGLEEDGYTAGLRALLLPVDPECRTRVCFGAGSGGLFRLRAREWQDLEDSAPAEAGFRFRASVARPGDTLLMCSGGFADPMREEEPLPAELAGRWSDTTAPGLAAFLADTQLRLKGYADDRTAAAVWEA